MNSAPKINIDIKKIEGFCKKHHICTLALFGSVLTSSFKPSSDIDFLVEFDKKHTPTLFALVDMESELSDLVGRKADLRTPQDISHFFRKEVLGQAKVIYDHSI